MEIRWSIQELWVCDAMEPANRRRNKIQDCREVNDLRGKKVMDWN